MSIIYYYYYKLILTIIYYILLYTINNQWFPAEDTFLQLRQHLAKLRSNARRSSAEVKSIILEAESGDLFGDFHGDFMDFMGILLGFNWLLWDLNGIWMGFDLGLQKRFYFWFFHGDFTGISWATHGIWDFPHIKAIWMAQIMINQGVLRYPMFRQNPI